MSDDTRRPLRDQQNGSKDDSREEVTLTKANETIAIRPTSGRLTLLSRRVFNALLYHAQQQGLSQTKYTIPLTELIADAKFGSKNTELLKDCIREMQTVLVEWNETNKDGGREWTAGQLLGGVNISEKGRGYSCTITWSYPENIRPYLIQPLQYTRILLETASQFRTYAASVLYEIGLKYLTSPGRLTMRESVLWWASVLTGRSDIESIDFPIFHRDTIKKALAEVGAVSPDFSLELIEHREGRKVAQLQFRVLPKKNIAANGYKVGQHEMSAAFDLAIIERLVDIGFKKNDAQNLYAATDEALLRATLEHVEQRIGSPGLPPLKSPPAYLRDALKKRYADLKSSTGNEKVPTGATNAELSTAERLQQLRYDWLQDRKERAGALFKEMPQDQQATYIERFTNEKLSELVSPVVKSWKNSGINSNIAFPFFLVWLAEVLWPDEKGTDADLLAFALSRGRI